MLLRRMDKRFVEKEHRRKDESKKADMTVHVYGVGACKEQSTQI